MEKENNRIEQIKTEGYTLNFETVFNLVFENYKINFLGFLLFLINIAIQKLNKSAPMLKNLYFLVVLFLIISCDSSTSTNTKQAEQAQDDKAITTYYQSGKVKSYCEVNELRKKHGVAKFYGEDGNLTKSFVYDNDEKITATQHYKNGNPLMEINYKNDQS